MPWCRGAVLALLSILRIKVDPSMLVGTLSQPFLIFLFSHFLTATTWMTNEQAFYLVHAWEHSIQIDFKVRHLFGFGFGVVVERRDGFAVQISKIKMYWSSEKLFF